MELQDQKKYICFESRKKDTETSTKRHEWNGMTQNGLFNISVMRMRKHHLFCTSSHHNVPYEKQQEFNKGSKPWNECPLLERVRNC